MSTVSASAAVLTSSSPLGDPGLDERALSATDAQEQWVFGRSPDVDFVLRDVAVSRRHAAIRFCRGARRWTVMDLKSSNGVYLDGSRVRPLVETPLADGAEVALGPAGTKYKWTFRLKEIEEKVEETAGDEEEDVGEPAAKRTKLSEPGQSGPSVQEPSCVTEKIDKSDEAQQSVVDRPVNGESSEAKVDESSQSKLEKSESSASPAAKKLLETFRSKFNEELSCSICNEIFIRPMLLPCQHVFCRFCLAKWKRQCQSRQYDCPNCRSRVGREKVVANLYLENLIASFTDSLGPEMKLSREKAIKEREEQEVEDAEEEEKKAAVRAERRGRGGGRGRGRGRAGRGTILAYMSSNHGDSGPNEEGEAGGSNDGGRYSLRSTRNPGSEIGSHNDSVVVISGDSDEDDEDLDLDGNSDDDEDGDSDDSDASVPGLPGARYGGYGNCYNCGRRGHWAPGCPY